MAPFYKTMHLDFSTLMTYCYLEGGGKSSLPHVTIRTEYLQEVLRRESAAAEACAAAAGRMSAPGSRRWDLSDLLMTVSVGASTCDELGVPQQKRGPGGKVYAQDDILQMLFVTGLRVIGPDQKVIQYVTFLRSASMSRAGDLSFINQAYAADVLDRLSLGLLTPCCDGREPFPWLKANVYVSKFSAYLGLALSDAYPIRFAREDGFHLDENSVVVVSDTVLSNQQYSQLELHKEPASLTRAPYPCGCYWPTDESGQVREQTCPGWASLTPFDGEGLITPDFAQFLRRKLRLPEDNRRISSFQVRLPMAKGMLHEVDFHKFFEHDFAEAFHDAPDIGDLTFQPGAEHPDRQEGLYILDAFGRLRALQDMKVILTVSMFKCFKWVKEAAPAGEDPMAWYFRKMEEKGQTLWVCRWNKPAAEQGNTALLNYQILATSGLAGENLRQLADRSLKAYVELSENTPAGDFSRFNKLAVITNDDQRGEEDAAEQAVEDEPLPLRLSPVSGDGWLQRSLPFVPQLLYSDRAKVLSTRLRDGSLRDAARGRMDVEGGTRFLSADLMTLLYALAWNVRLTAAGDGTKREAALAAVPKSESCMRELTSREYDAPGYKVPDMADAAFQDTECPKNIAALFRNPHMSREEHLLLRRVDEKKRILRDQYLSHLEGILMLPTRSSHAQRLGGADFDGDIVRLITDANYVKPLYQNLKAAAEELGVFRENDLPFLPMVSIEAKAGKIDKARILEAEDLKNGGEGLRAKEFVLWNQARNNQIGRYSNVAVHYCGSAYDNEKPEPAHRQYVRTLTALVGYEIDSVKTGFAPKAPQFVTELRRSDYAPFLKYVAQAKKYQSVSPYTGLPPRLKKKLAESRENGDDDSKLEKKFTGAHFSALDAMPFFVTKTAAARLQDAKVRALCAAAEKQYPEDSALPRRLEEAYRKGEFLQKNTEEANAVQSPRPAGNEGEGLREIYRKLMWRPGYPGETLARKLIEDAGGQADALVRRGVCVAAILADAYQDVVTRTEEPGQNEREQIKRLLFVQYPDESEPRREERTEALTGLLRDWIGQARRRQADAASKGEQAAPTGQTSKEKDAIADALTKLKSAFGDPAFFLADEEAYLNMLTAELKRFRETVIGDDDLDAGEQERFELFLECCKNRTCGGFRLPLLAAAAGQAFRRAPERDLPGEKAALELRNQQLRSVWLHLGIDAKRPNEADCKKLLQAFTVRLLAHSGSRSALLAALRREFAAVVDELRNHSDAKEKDPTVLAVLLAAGCTCPAFFGGLSGIPEETIQYLLPVVRAERSRQRFLWDAAGQAVFAVIKKKNSGNIKGYTREDFEEYRRTLRAVPGEGAGV